MHIVLRFFNVIANTRKLSIVIFKTKLVPVSLCGKSHRFNPYPGKWGVKWPPVHFCLCISENVRYTAVHFWDIVQDPEGYLSLYKVQSHLYRKCGHDGVKPEVQLRNQRKVVCLIVTLMITSNKHFHVNDAILVIWSRHVPHDVVSPFIEFMDT